MDPVIMMELIQTYGNSAVIVYAWWFAVGYPTPLLMIVLRYMFSTNKNVYALTYTQTDFDVTRQFEHLDDYNPTPTPTGISIIFNPIDFEVGIPVFIKYLFTGTLLCFKNADNEVFGGIRSVFHRGAGCCHAVSLDDVTLDESQLGHWAFQVTHNNHDELSVPLEHVPLDKVAEKCEEFCSWITLLIEYVENYDDEISVHDYNEDSSTYTLIIAKDDLVTELMNACVYVRGLI
jgi:hypothetical protein